MLIVRGVNICPTQIEALILRVPSLTPHYLLEVSREGRLDTMTIRVERAPGAAGSDVAAVGALTDAVKAHVGISVKVSVEPAGSLQRSAGKAQRVIDQRAGG